MPVPAESGRRYVAGLDGLRALAVACVVVYHLGVSWAPGGMLGVGVFFTLSGYLITDLLLGHWRRHGHLGLGAFWLRRARRLLPALFVMLAAVSLWVALLDADQLEAVRRQVVAATFYFANWSTIAAHGSYFSRFAAPLPLDHLWSLSIEEQFYLVWPWLLAAGIWTLRRRAGLLALTLLGCAASILLMSRLHHPGYDPTRVYEGTDTRAFGLLFGAALAVVWSDRPRRRGARDLLDLAGLLGLAGIAILVWRVSAVSAFLYPAGFVLLSLATVAVLAAVTNPTSRLGRALGCAPLRWIGVRSYGIYLWQWPVIVLGDELYPTAPRVLRGAAEVAVTVVIAALSWRFVEEPIRAGALARLRRRSRSRFRGAGRARRALRSAAAVAVLALGLVAVSLAGALPVLSRTGGATPRLAALRSQALTRLDPPRHPYRRRVRPLTLATATRTSCHAVVYIGDSTSEGEIASDYIPNPALQLPAQLARVGVGVTFPEISGARSVVETHEGHPNAATVAQAHISSGFHGCWILALGTNEAANVKVGSNVGLRARIDRMMSSTAGQPVLWIDAITLVDSGPYAEDGMQQWNHQLLAACHRYPNLRVFDWAAHVRRPWFIPDGIHYFGPGYIARAHLFARALAAAFPARGVGVQGCVVG